MAGLTKNQLAEMVVQLRQEINNLKNENRKLLECVFRLGFRMEKQCDQIRETLHNEQHTLEKTFEFLEIFLNKNEVGSATEVNKFRSLLDNPNAVWKVINPQKEGGSL